MKPQNLRRIFLVLYFLFGLGLAAAQTEPEFLPQRIPAPKRHIGEQTRPRVRRSMSDPNAPPAAVRTMAAGAMQQEAHNRLLEWEKNRQKLIGQLAEIKKLAQEEGASKTAAALQELIDQQNKELQKDTEELQNRRMEMQKRYQERIIRRQLQGVSPENHTAKTPEQTPAAGQDKKQSSDAKKKSK